MKFSNLDLRYFELATKISKYSSHYKASIGSVIIYNKSVLSLMLEISPNIILYNYFIEKLK
jgi:hypothetical protein